MHEKAISRGGAENAEEGDFSRNYFYRYAVAAFRLYDEIFSAF